MVIDFIVFLKKSRFILLLLLSLVNYAFAQPGGGGGLDINSFYNANGSLISRTDTSLHIIAFLLEDSTVESPILAQLEETYIFGKKVSNSSSEIHCNLPPGNIRLYIIYQKDTMLLDLIGIIDENGAGIHDYMDSIVIQPGYYRYRRDIIGNFPTGEGYTERQNRLQQISHGLTPRTLRLLTNTNVIKFQDELDIAELTVNNRRSVFFLEEGISNYHSKKNNKAITSINKSIALGLKIEDKIEAYLWLYRIYIEEDANDQRVDALAKLLSLNLSLNDSDLQAHLFQRLNAVINANLKTNGVNDDIISDLQYITQSIPVSYKSHTFWSEYHYWSEYAQLYALLGNASYWNGDLKYAINCWLKAEALGFKNNRERINLDSIIQKHPDLAELHLLKAISLLNRGVKAMHTNQYDGSYKQKSFYQSVLKEVTIAENKGSNDFKINMLKALVFSKILKTEEALNQINIAINKNSNYARLFLYRFEIRVKLGLAVANDWKDADMVTFTTLIENKSW